MNKTKHILIVDDSSTNIILLDNLLSHRGYITLIASDAKSALSIIEKTIPDLIILDLLMPFVDGYEFLNIIRNDQRSVDIPVIILSAVTDPYEIERARAFGIIEYCKKPLIINQFIELVDSFFNKTKN